MKYPLSVGQEFNILCLSWSDENIIILPIYRVDFNNVILRNWLHNLMIDGYTFPHTQCEKCIVFA